MNKRFAVRLMAFVVSMLLGVASAAAGARDVKPDTLLAIDMNRKAVIDNIVHTWQGQLTAGHETILRDALAKMRADRLLAAALVPSLDGLQTIMNSEDNATNLASRAVLAKAASTDLTYNPVAPCRIFDTRVAYGGAGPLLVDAPRDVATIAPLSGQGSIPGCSVPAGAGAVVLQMGSLLPPALGYIAGGPQGAADFPNALVLYQPGQQYSTSATLPLNTANGEFTLVARFGQTEAYADLLGYFSASSSGGSIGVGDIVTKTADYTLTTSDYTVICNNGGTGAVTLTLPAAAGNTGRIFVIKRTNTGAGQSNACVVANLSSTEGPTLTLNAPQGGGSSAVMVQSDGTNWWILSNAQ